MPDARPTIRRRPSGAVWIAVVAVLALTAGLGLWRSSTAPAATPATPASARGTDIDRGTVRLDSATALPIDDLAQLVASSSLVVAGEVLDVSRGRLYAGEVGGTGIESAVVTFAVSDVLAGSEPGSTVLIEEEGWTGEGRRIAVDGAPPLEVGDQVVWFLTATGDPDLPAWVSVGVAGRWVNVDGELVGPDRADPLVREIASIGPEELADRVRSIAGALVRPTR